jgi:hypothetical protein
LSRPGNDAVLSRVAGAFAPKWDGRWQFTARDGCFRDADGSGEAMVFSVTPVKVFADAKGDPFGATTGSGGTARTGESRCQGRFSMNAL